MKNCIEKLRDLDKNNWECEDCVINNKIIEFYELPKELKSEFDYYDKDKDYLLYCDRCDHYQII